MKRMYIAIGVVVAAAVGITAYLLHNLDDLHEDARKHRIRQLGRMGDQP